MDTKFLLLLGNGRNKDFYSFCVNFGISIWLHYRTLIEKPAALIKAFVRLQVVALSLADMFVGFHLFLLSQLKQSKELFFLGGGRGKDCIFFL